MLKKTVNYHESGQSKGSWRKVQNNKGEVDEKKGRKMERLIKRDGR
jgi:hypothetical protein